MFVVRSCMSNQSWTTPGGCWSSSVAFASQGEEREQREDELRGVAAGAVAAPPAHLVAAEPLALCLPRRVAEVGVRLADGGGAGGRRAVPICAVRGARLQAGES